MEGYLWDDEGNKQAILKACKYAHKHRRSIALSLSDRSCVERNRKEFMDLIKSHVDILFCNEDELKLLLEEDDLHKALDLIKIHVEFAAITRSVKGSVVVNGRTKTFVEAEQIDEVVDTTGAGDLYAAGFLYGMSQGRSLGTCAMIGSIVAAEIISHYGARPEVSLRGLVRKKLLAYGKKP